MDGKNENVIFLIFDIYFSRSRSLYYVYICINHKSKEHVNVITTLEEVVVVVLGGRGEGGGGLGVLGDGEKGLDMMLN
jgi:hypothetical protein